MADGTYGLRTIAVRIGPRGVHAWLGILLLAMIVTAIVGGLSIEDAVVWRRLATAVVLGLAVPWFLWRRIASSETGVSLGMMAWRYLAAAAVLGSGALGEE